MYGTAAVMMVPEPQTFNKGLVFVKDTDILLSGDKWTIAVIIALDQGSSTHGPRSFFPWPAGHFEKKNNYKRD